MSWIQTYTGKKFDLFNPRAVDVCIEDIAHALANTCRFNGHCRKFYSVAEHCIIAARHVSDPEFKVALLLHDATEAYIGDIVSPLKRHLMKNFHEVENRIMEAVGVRFDVPMALFESETVRRIDIAMCATEARDLMKEPPESWGLTEKPLDVTLPLWTPWQAEKTFKDCFYRIMGARGRRRFIEAARNVERKS